MNLRSSTALISLFALVTGLAAGATAADDAAATKPNVLFIAIDDLRPELGCYGRTEIQSPHIDELAAHGVVFERAYCQLAVCNPSRVSIMTGLRPDSTKVWDLATRFRNTIPDAVTLPQHFMKHGYHAVSYGKIFHNPWPDNDSWSEPHAWPRKSSLWSDEAKTRLAEYRNRMRAEGRSESQLARLRAQATEIVDIPDNEHIDGAIAEQALAAMRRLAEQDKPFFLATGFIRPHLPFVVPRKYWNFYAADAIPTAANAFLPKDAPAFAMNTMYELRDYFDFDGTPVPHEGSLSEAQQRRLKHGYYASVSFIDSLVGRLLSELDALKLADNTIVVLWGDHGWKLGEHNSWCKQTNYEIDARVPLIIRAPDAESNGRKSNALVELVDVYPTLCELAGLPVAENLEGRSMVPLLSDSDQPWKLAAFSQFPRRDGRNPLMGYAMRTDRYRYIEWQDRRTREVVATELYDHDHDPLENTSIAVSSVHSGRLEDLSRQMWASLPTPPKYTPKTAPRPQVIFKNRGDVPLTLFWVKPDGEEKKSAVIQPGAQTQRGTTLGHRFRVRGPGGFSRTFEVKEQRQTFEVATAVAAPAVRGESRPNIVFCMADDWSWPHAGILGDPAVATPHFDRVAREGVLFENAFVSTPSCTPSRLSILTGQHHWRLREGDSLGGSLREDYDVYTEMLQDAGYRIGRFGKGVWPSKHSFRNRDSFGERFRSFDEFLKDRKPNEPFCYWHGGQDPHRPYEPGIGKKSGINLSDVKVPACLPDNKAVRSDVADYLWEVQRFDREVGEIVARLRAIGELDNTIVVVSGDNGMPFPRCKATLYDQGTRVPLAIRWGSKVAGRRQVADFVSLCDLAPTFLEAAGAKPSEQMTGRSLMPLLKSQDSGRIDATRTFALTGMERHVYPYPARAIRTKDFLFIRNFGPDKWPTGEVAGHNPTYDFVTEPWPTESGAFSFNVDPSPAKQFLRLHRTDAAKRYADLAFGRRPAEELYDLRQDPDQLTNVASDLAYAETRRSLSRQLNAELIKSDDPRVAVDGYSPRTIEGWPIRVSDELMQTQEPATRRAIELLGAQLQKVRDVLPPAALASVRTVPIWLSPKYDGVRPTGEYHPGADWLRDNERDPALHQSVEFTTIAIFEREIQRMPMMVLHELAHAYHDQVLAFDNPQIKEAYERAKNRGIYEAVRRGNGKTERAYAITNHKEYFAELSEAYFGINDFYPFNRTELQKHDPDMVALLSRVWGEEDETDGDAPSSTNFNVVPPPAALNLDPFYKKYINANGYPIVASQKVNDYALKEAAYLVDLMLAKRPDVRKAMVASGSRLIVMAHDEFTTDVPEHAHLSPKDHWDRRARGLGGSLTDPVCSCAEENLLAFKGDPYSTENILIHEFAHNIHLRGMVNVDATFDDRVKQAWKRAMSKGLWKDKYAATNHHEYFAEGVQSWFDNNRQPDHDHNHVDTRKELREYDPGLAALCEEVFGATKLVYTKPATRLTGHLEGYDPAQAPTFGWPQRLKDANP